MSVNVWYVGASEKNIQLIGWLGVSLVIVKLNKYKEIVEAVFKIIVKN